MIDFDEGKQCKLYPDKLQHKDSLCMGQKFKRAFGKEWNKRVQVKVDLICNLGIILPIADYKCTQNFDPFQGIPLSVKLQFQAHHKKKPQSENYELNNYTELMNLQNQPNELDRFNRVYAAMHKVVKKSFIQKQFILPKYYKQLDGIGTDNVGVNVFVLQKFQNNLFGFLLNKLHSQEQLKKWVYQIYEMGSQLYTHQLVNNDIRPQNIMLDSHYNLFMTETDQLRKRSRKIFDNQCTMTPEYSPSLLGLHDLQNQIGFQGRFQKQMINCDHRLDLYQLTVTAAMVFNNGRLHSTMGRFKPTSFHWIRKSLQPCEIEYLQSIENPKYMQEQLSNLMQLKIPDMIWRANIREFLEYVRLFQNEIKAFSMRNVIQDAFDNSEELDAWTEIMDHAIQGYYFGEGFKALKKFEKKYQENGINVKEFLNQDALRMNGNELFIQVQIAFQSYNLGNALELSSLDESLQESPKTVEYEEEEKEYDPYLQDKKNDEALKALYDDLGKPMVTEESQSIPQTDSNEDTFDAMQRELNFPLFKGCINADSDINPSDQGLPKKDFQ